MIAKYHFLFLMFFNLPVFSAVALPSATMAPAKKPSRWVRVKQSVKKKASSFKNFIKRNPKAVAGVLTLTAGLVAGSITAGILVKRNLAKKNTKSIGAAASSAAITGSSQVGDIKVPILNLATLNEIAIIFWPLVATPRFAENPQLIELLNAFPIPDSVGSNSYLSDAGLALLKVDPSVRSVLKTSLENNKSWNIPSQIDLALLEAFLTDAMNNIKVDCSKMRYLLRFFSIVLYGTDLPLSSSDFASYKTLSAQYVASTQDLDFMISFSYCLMNSKNPDYSSKFVNLVTSLALSETEPVFVAANAEPLNEAELQAAFYEIFGPATKADLMAIEEFAKKSSNYALLAQPVKEGLLRLSFVCNTLINRLP